MRVTPEANTAGRASGAQSSAEILVHGVCQPTDESARFQQAPLTNEAAASLNALQRITEMNKLLAALIVAAFATTGAFAADAKKDEKKAAPAAAAAPAAKKEEAKPAAAAAAPAAKKEEAKPAKAAAPAAKKEEPKK
jgi:lysophospholipase